MHVILKLCIVVIEKVVQKLFSTLDLICINKLQKMLSITLSYKKKKERKKEKTELIFLNYDADFQI